MLCTSQSTAPLKQTPSLLHLSQGSIHILQGCAIHHGICPSADCYYELKLYVFYSDLVTGWSPAHTVIVGSRPEASSVIWNLLPLHADCCFKWLFSLSLLLSADGMVVFNLLGDHIVPMRALSSCTGHQQGRITL